MANEEMEKETMETEEPAEETVEETAEVEEADVTVQISEANERYMRLFAEFDNYRKRTAKEKADTYAHAIADSIEKLLPVLDSFELALKTECSDEAFKNGMEKINQQFKAILEKQGVTEMKALGEPFDPNFHHAIKQEENTEYPEGTVCQVYQSGYLLGDKVIRPAMVAVSTGE